MVAGKWVAENKQPRGKYSMQWYEIKHHGLNAQARDKKGNTIKPLYEYYKEKHKQLNSMLYVLRQQITL
jgi:hypothetical protein